MNHSIRTAISVSLIILALPGSGNAQQSEPGTLSEITVTATKRQEDIQDVPISVVAITSENIRTLGIVDMRDIAQHVPNVEISDNPVIANIYMRGLGSGRSQIIEQSVGLFVDEIYQGRSQMNLHPMFDVSNVEVLRGPQGTLFGKNTAAGALIVRTNEPTNEFQGTASATIGQYSTVNGYYNIDGAVSGPASDNVAYRLAFRYNDDGGFVKNRAEGPDGVERQDTQVRLKLNWDISDRTGAKFMAEYNHFDSDGEGSAQMFNHAPDMVAGFQAIVPTFVDQAPNWETDVPCNLAAAFDFCPGRDQTYTRLKAEISHDFSGGNFSSITAYQTYDFDHLFITDPVMYLQAVRQEEFNGFSQEFRFTSELGEKFDYIAGLFYENTELDRDETNHLNFAFHPRLSFLGNRDGIDNWMLKNETVAVFGEMRWHLSDAVSVIFGGRWGREEKEYDYFGITTAYYDENTILALPNDPRIFTDQKRDESEFTPSFTMRWSAADQAMLYFRYAEGSKSGGFDDRVLAPTQELEYDSESSRLSEVGAKMSWLDGKFDLNATVFHTKFEDLQVASELQGQVVGFLLLNAAEATSQGLELDGRLFLSDSWMIGGSYGYLDATYDSFPNAPCIAVPGPECQANNAGAMVQDLAGETLAFAPEHKLSMYVNFDHKLANSWRLNSTASISYSDEYFGDLDADPLSIQDAYTKIDASVELESPDGKWSVMLLGRNLTEEVVYASSFDTPIAGAPGQNAYLDSPREVALKFSYQF